MSSDKRSRLARPGFGLHSLCMYGTIVVDGRSTQTVTRSPVSYLPSKVNTVFGPYLMWGCGMTGILLALFWIEETTR